MSKNRNRARLNKTNTSKEYKCELILILYPPYDDYNWSWHGRNMPNHKWRSYKTWKHNRKTKYKDNV